MKTMEPVMHLNWPMILVALMLIAFYFLVYRRLSWKSWIYFAGVALLLAITISPLDFIGHHYLFSAHMTQHIFILLIVPPLLLIGLEGDEIKKLQIPRVVSLPTGLILHPVVAWIIGIGMMWFWHIPAVFLSMKASPWMHFLHLLSLLVAGIIFIWPVHSPVSWKKLSSPLMSVLYLFMACVGCTLLGIILTFSTELYYAQSYIYDSYVNVIPDAIRMTPATDQQVAGLIMWVPACVVYIINSMVILARWLKTPEPGYDERI